MPHHSVLGDYNVGHDGSVEFGPIILSGVEVEPVIYTDGSQIPADEFAALCNLFSQAQELASVAKAHVVATWEEHFLELVNDLVLSNPDMDILSEMFPGANVRLVSDIDQGLVATSIHATNVMGWYGKQYGHTFTIDIRFKDGEFDQLFAVQFDDDGQVLSVSQES